MPPQFRPLVAPTSSNSGNPDVNNRSSRYMFFKPNFGNTVQFFKPGYDRNTKPVTVFRPFPCTSFDQPNAFIPYRIDTGGNNYFGYWIKRVYVAWNVGRPSMSFIVHDMDSKNMFDSRQIPLSILTSAVKHAVKKGQGKAQEWGTAIRRAFEPDAATVLDWSGWQDGGNNENTPLSYAREMSFMQGMIPQLGGQAMGGAGKPIPGWKNTDYTCVFGLTQGPTKKLFSLLAAEKPGFRGNSNDFENRYVNGDPVGLANGRFIYIYPYGGGAVQQSQPVDIYADSPSRGQQKSEEEEKFGFDLHLDKKFGNNYANLTKFSETVYSKWRHWDDLRVRTEDGREEIEKGILWYPTYVEQAKLLSSVFPAQMLEYAFYGSHNEWLDEDILKSSREARSATVPANPPRASVSADENPFGTSDDNDENWGASEPEPTNVAPTREHTPVNTTVADSATLGTPSLTDVPAISDSAPSSIDDLFESISQSAESALDGFDPETEEQQDKPDGPSRTAKSLAELAAAKAALRDKK